MTEVIQIDVLDEYKLRITFNDSEKKVVNIRPFLGKGFTKELLEYDYFKQVEIEEGGGIAWPNGYDFCPNFLKELQGEELVA
ncbi:MAG: DUF2442 domain-containing protein [Cyclobacteriaceae bacterium]